MISLILISTGSIISCKFTLSGTVTDINGDPIEGVEIKVAEGLTDTTDALGEYSIADIPYGNYTAIATHPDYKTEVRNIDTSYLDNGLSCKNIDGNFYFRNKNQWEILANLPCQGFDSLRSVFFIDSNNGWTCGYYGGGLFNTTDGGKNWINQECPDAQNSESVFFVNNNTGWICGDGIYNTTDGGTTWNNQYNGYYDMSSIYFKCQYRLGLWAWYTSHIKWRRKLEYSKYGFLL